MSRGFFAATRVSRKLIARWRRSPRRVDLLCRLEQLEKVRVTRPPFEALPRQFLDGIVVLAAHVFFDGEENQVVLSKVLGKAGDPFLGTGQRFVKALMFLEESGETQIVARCGKVVAEDGDQGLDVAAASWRAGSWRSRFPAAVRVPASTDAVSWCEFGELVPVFQNPVLISGESGFRPRLQRSPGGCRVERFEPPSIWYSNRRSASLTGSGWRRWQARR